MAHLKQTSHLTQGYRADIAKTMQQTHKGQAHFANGPLGATCAMCIHYGCWKQIRNASGEVVNTSRVQGACAKYKELTGKIGPAVPANASACKYFLRKKEEENQNQNGCGV
jgi:hypothetical protein